MQEQEQFTRLKKLRLQADLTIQEVADLSGVTPKTVWSSENGKRKPHDRTVYRITKALEDAIERRSKDAA